MTLVDRYLEKRFTRTYNCFSFTRDVWLELTNIDLGDQTPKEFGIDVYNEQALKVANTLIKLEKPENPSIVLLQRSRIEPHIGVYHGGRVLHLTKAGAYYMPLDQVSAGYTKIGFYK